MVGGAVSHPTASASGWRDSVAFSGFFYTLSESYSQAESTPARQQVTHTVSRLTYWTQL
jgi:hypothetical protein